MTFKKYLVLMCLMVCATFGDFFLKLGMNRQPHIGMDHPLALFGVLSDPWIILGVLTLICFFSCYIASLSWADLTFIMPATSFGYVLTAVLAHVVLREQITYSRWAGILLITAGVGFVTRGPSHTEGKGGAKQVPIPDLHP